MFNAVSWVKFQGIKRNNQTWSKVFLFAPSNEIAEIIQRDIDSPIRTIFIRKRANGNQEFSTRDSFSWETLNEPAITSIFFEEKQKCSQDLDSRPFLILNALDIIECEYQDGDALNYEAYDRTLFSHFQIYKSINSLNLPSVVIHLANHQNYLKGIGRGITLSLNKESSRTKYIHLEVKDPYIHNWKVLHF